MMLSPADAVTIYERASSLAERLSGTFAPKDEHNGQGERHLSQWQQTAAVDDSQRLAELASAMGMQPAGGSGLPALLGPIRLLPGATVPPWTCFLAEIVEATANAFSASNNPFPIARSTKIPFWQLYQPVAALVRTQVAKRMPDAASLLGESAWADLQGWLLRRVSAIASTALHTKFIAQQFLEAPGMVGLFRSAQPVSGDMTTAKNQERYYRFVREEGRDGLRVFFLRYPVAARLMAETALNWIDGVGEFLQRYQRDRAELAGIFNHGLPLPPVVRIRSGLSDPHNGGRTVLALTFKGGLRLVYKPRSLRMDVLYFDLLKVLNIHLPELNLSILNVLDKICYGWAEFVQAAPCSSKTGARKFYHRAGCLVALTHWLQGIDFHRENLVAAGEQPVLIDLETLAHPLSHEEIAFAQEHGAASLALSPVRSGLLPLWQAPFGKDVFYDNSALGGPISRRALFPTVRWHHVGTDQIMWKYALEVRSHRAHRPRWHNRILTPEQFSTDIQRGYRAMAQLLSGSAKPAVARYREEISATARRRIKRPTQIYSLLLRQSLQPERLTSGIARSIGLQALPCRHGEEAEWAAEIASLERLDVPYFTLPITNVCTLDLGQFGFDRFPDVDHWKQISAAIRKRLMLQNGRIRML